MPSEDTRCGPCAAAPHRQVPPPDSMQSQGRLEMTTEQRCGLEGGVGLGCRAAGRAEAFARSLHHKLCSLGGPAAGQRPASPEDADDAEDTEEDPEDSWSSAPSAAHRTLSSSSVDSSSDMYYDLDFSPQSPQEEITSQELAGMMAGSSNRDGLNLAFGSFAPHNGPQSPQSDCSSDYFDTDAFEGDANRDRGPSTRTPTEVALPPGGDHGVTGPEPQTNGEATARLTNGTTAVNGHGSNREEAKAKRPWNRVPHKYKAGTPEAMSEVSQLELDDCDDDEEEDRPRIRRGTLAKLSFAKSSQTLMQEGLIAQLKQGLDIPPELKNGVCPGPECAGSAPANGGRGLAAMKEAARTLEALETPEESSAYASSSCDGRAGPELPEAVSGSSRPAGGEKPEPGEEVETERCEDDACNAEDDSGLNGHEQAEMDGDDDEGRRPRIRRCSSLKTGKTPPGTPGRKKIVRFADVLGLDLADVRTFLDEIPKVPTSAYSDLRDVDPQGDVSAACCDVLGSGLPQLALAFHAVAVADAPPPFGVRPHVTRVLVPLFQQPGGMVDFLERVRERQVCLENAVVADPALLSIAGQVRVRNLDFHKTVHLRYTTDGWRNFADLQATYVPNSCDGFSDKFTFTLFAGHTMTVGQRLEMAVRFQCKGQQYWDSNGGANYCFQCLPPSSVPPTALPVSSLHSPCGDDSWKYLF